MRVIVLILLFLALSLNVEALAVASDYLEDSTLELIEETSTIYSIRLQNPDSDELRVRVDYNKAHMKALDFKEEYILEPGSVTRIEFNVTAPKYNKRNNEFVMGFTVHQLTGAGSGVGFLPQISKQIKLKVVQDPDRFRINYFYLGYVVVLLAVIFFLYRKKKHSGKN